MPSIFCLPLALILLGVGVPMPGAATMASPEKPNVLFVAVDDMNTELGCYGREGMHTPNIDRLASMGVRFDRAYCQYPLCSPSRVSALTGLRPDATGVYDLKLYFRENIPEAVTLPQLFMQHGYYVARVGKIFHFGNPGEIGTQGLDDPISWHEALNPCGRDKDEEALVTNFTPARGLGSSLSLLRAEGTDEEQTDGIVATETIRLMEANKDRRFFIAAGFYRPHCPYIAPAKYFDLYPLESVTVPAEPFEEIRSVPKSALDSTHPWPRFGVTEDNLRTAKQAYQAAVSFVDAQVGRLLDALDRLGLTDKTIVVFWSDHGYHFGEHGLVKKNSLFEMSARVPMIIAVPGAQGNGRSSPRTVGLIDLYPTLADLAGLAPPSNLGGKSLVPLLHDPSADWSRPAFTQINQRNATGYSVRTERWRYTLWSTKADAAQFYDYEHDPGELRNLAGDPAYAGVETRLRAMVEAYRDDGVHLMANP